jgi:imidazolonepropionase-like amidohydrolase
MSGSTAAIRAAQLWDGQADDMVARPLVRIADGVIVSVTAGGTAPAGVMDLGDVTLLPGLIDAHTHLALDASPDAVANLQAGTDDEVLAGMRQAARRALLAGVTVVQDLGDRSYLALRLRDELADRPAGGPKVLASGPPITSPRGHCWFMGGEADGVDGVRAAVRERASRGVDVVKVMASGGELTAGTQAHEAQFSAEELRAIAEEAAVFGLRTTAHAHGAAGIGSAVAAGFRSIQHATFITADSAEIDETVLAAMVDRGVTVTVTSGSLPNVPRPPRIEARGAALTKVFQTIREAGLRLVCASDAGLNPAKPHDVLPHGVVVMVERIGVTPADALRSVTSFAAQECGLVDRYGQLAPGYAADLLAVNGNPLTDIHAITNVAAVFRAGVRIR